MVVGIQNHIHPGVVENAQEGVTAGITSEFIRRTEARLMPICGSAPGLVPLQKLAQPSPLLRIRCEINLRVDGDDQPFPQVEAVVATTCLAHQVNEVVGRFRCLIVVISRDRASPVTVSPEVGSWHPANSSRVPFTSA